MKKVSFKMFLNISAWLFLILTGIWGIGIVGPIDLGFFSAIILLGFLVMTVSSFVVHSYMKEYPENQTRYFIEWLILLTFVNGIAFTIAIFA